ncbi:hypothetical protein M9H77_13856 [Catharanthus roseus]|uniref:Uncharacterized protein n=1 Tax=Catharanthus roseus TaxID=4058 RepID=A0ACC0BLC7_CATRO|nr:hypothetical protein M9H77_13856 [Catharanthus roseus]
MYEVSQNVDLSLEVDALSKKLDQLLALNTLPTNSPNVQSLEAKTQILDSHTQSIAKLETQIGQLANAISRRDEGKLPIYPIENPRANYHEQAKAVITLRNGKLVNNKVGKPIKNSELNKNETNGIDMGTKIEKKIEKELASYSNSKTLESSPMTSYKPKKKNSILSHYARNQTLDSPSSYTLSLELPSFSLPLLFSAAATARASSSLLGDQIDEDHSSALLCCSFLLLLLCEVPVLFSVIGGHAASRRAPLLTAAPSCCYGAQCCCSTTLCFCCFFKLKLFFKFEEKCFTMDKYFEK